MVDRPERDQRPMPGDEPRPDNRNQRGGMSPTSWRDAAYRLSSARPHNWSPWLVIRYQRSDMGLRAIPAADPFWLSPDIWVESSDPLGNAVAGQENFVHARILNLGKATAAPTRVDFYWANPSLGLGPDTMVHIGTEWVEVEAHTAHYVRCNRPWVPVLVNNGHECLVVNCTNPILDPIAQPFQPRLDRHVGQRNITVVQSLPGQMVEFSLVVSNLFPLAARTIITARVEYLATSLRDRKKRMNFEAINQIAGYGASDTNTPEMMKKRFKEGTAESRLANLLAEIIQTGPLAQPLLVSKVAGGAGFRGTACISSKFTDYSCLIKQSGAQGFLGQQLLAADKLTAPGPCVDLQRNLILQDTILAAAEQRRLNLQLGVPANARKDEFVVFQIDQRAEGHLVGGYTVILQIK